MAVILVFSLICYPADVDGHRDFISHILKYLFFTYKHKRNNVTVAFFPEIYEHFPKIHVMTDNIMSDSHPGEI